MLDQAVSTALFRMRSLERAIHDPGPWSIVIDGIRYPARRTMIDRGVSFIVIVPQRVCSMTTKAVLECDGDAVSVQDVELSAGASELSWTIDLARSA